MIDITSEELIPLSEVPTLPALARRKPDQRTIRRWATVGLKGQKLETIQRAGVRCTTVLALMRFFEQLGKPAAPPRPPTTKQAAKAQERARNILKKLGV